MKEIEMSVLVVVFINQSSDRSAKSNEYLGFLISKCFVQVPEDVMMKCPYSYIEQGDPVSFEQLSMNQSETEDSGYQLYIENCFAGLLQVIISIIFWAFFQIQ